MGKLFIISTPIGNMEDITLRALRILSEVDALACEDTRRTRNLFTRHNITAPRIVFSYWEHNEQIAGRRILDLLGQDCSVALCSDGGMPGISDPGYRIIRSAIDNDHIIDVIPGPSAVLNALVASGLPSSSFTFKGFPPRKTGALVRFLMEDVESSHTLIFFESPHRLLKFLQATQEVYGDRSSAVCLEMTKMHQSITRGSLAELVGVFTSRRVKGEATVVISGNKMEKKI